MYKFIKIRKQKNYKKKFFKTNIAVNKNKNFKNLNQICFVTQ